MLDDPRLALRLYVAILAIAVMFSPRWSRLVAAVKEAKANGNTENHSH